MSCDRVTSIATISCSSSPIISAKYGNSTNATLGTFISILEFINFASAVVAFPAPIFPISFRISI